LAANNDFDEEIIKRLTVEALKLQNGATEVICEFLKDQKPNKALYFSQFSSIFE
jgi:hypothetical protein